MGRAGGRPPERDEQPRRSGRARWRNPRPGRRRRHGAAAVRIPAAANARRHPNRYAVIICREPEAGPPTAAEARVTEPLQALTARLCPDCPLVAARVLWSYLHGAVSLRLTWATRDGLDPEEAFAAGLEALEAWLAAGARAPSTDARRSRSSSPEAATPRSDACAVQTHNR